MGIKYEGDFKMPAIESIEKINKALNCTILWKFKGFVPTPKHWGEDMGKLKGIHPHFLININKQTFDYYGSMVDGKEGKTELTVKDLLNSLNAIARDAMDAKEMDFEQWASNLGYSDDSIQALKVYKMCVKELRKLEKAGVDVYELEELTREDDD